MKEADQILFQQYLDKALDASQLVAFERRLREDANFNAAFELYQVMEAHLAERNKNKSALEALREVHKKHSKEVTGEARNYRLWMSIAAVGMLLVACWLLFDKMTDREPTYAELYQEPPWRIDRADGRDSLLSLALQDYSTDLKQTVDNLKALDIDPFVQNRWVAEVFAYHASPDSVIFYLPQETPNNVMRDRINYLSILSYWRKGDRQQALRQIGDLPSDTDDYYLQIYSKISK